MKACSRCGHHRWGWQGVCPKCGYEEPGPPPVEDDAPTVAERAAAVAAWGGDTTTKMLLGLCVILLAVIAIQTSSCGPADRQVVQERIVYEAAPEPVLQLPPAEPQPAGLEMPIIVPDPATLDIVAEPLMHYRLNLVSNQSALVQGSMGGKPLLIHNNADLVGQDLCGAPPTGPEGDTRLIMVVPEPGIESAMLFYMVACEPGRGEIVISAGDAILNLYQVDVR